VLTQPTNVRRNQWGQTPLKNKVASLAMPHPWPNIPVELTGHSVGFFSFVTVVACGQQLTGGVILN